MIYASNPSIPNLSYEVATTTATTTASGTDSIISGMSQAVPAGTYFVSFSGNFTHSVSGDYIVATIYNGTTAIPTTLRIFYALSLGVLAGNSTGIIATHCILSTTAASTTISVQWNTNGATATCNQRNLDIVRLT